MTKICIIGCGTYGSYLLKRLLASFPNVSITVVEIGDKHIKNEEEIGFQSESKLSNSSHLGRYFGLGGTSARWGGQLLFFDKRDNISGDADWTKIISINEKYKQKVVENLLDKSAFSKLMQEENDKNIKTGIWLKYSRRNLFKQITKQELKRINLIENHRIIDFIIDQNRIIEVICANKQGEIKKINADLFYLTAGALESCRLLMELNKKYSLFNDNLLGKNLGDHLSTELFKISNTNPIINNIDFSPYFYKGSLITKRFIVYGTDGRVGYLHPVFNKDIRIFSSIKNMLFGKQKIAFQWNDIMVGIVFLLKLFYSIVFLKRLYVDKKSWRLNLDIEQSYPNKNAMKISENRDKYLQSAINIDWQISKEDYEAISTVKEEAIKLLDQNNFNYTTSFGSELTMQKVEDTYHPVGFIKMGSKTEDILDFFCKVRGTTNLFHFSTAMFSTAKTINPTAAVFCFIEDHLTLIDLQEK